MNITISHGILESSTKISLNLYRGILAVAAGITTKPEDLYNPWLDKTDWNIIRQYTDFFGYWKIEPKDPIWYLLAHSDSAGCIKSEHALLLANRLKELLPNLPEKSSAIKISKLFIKGLKAAAKNDEEITFKIV